MNWVLLKNSLLVSGVATLGAVVLGFGVALWLAGLGGRWRMCFLVLAVVPLSLPSFLVTGSWLRYLGGAGVWRNWFPLDLYSPLGAAWILMLMLWPIPMVAALGGWDRIGAEQLEAEPALGGGGLIRWLLWPMARGSMGWAVPLTFVLAWNNFSVPAILQVRVFPAELWIRFSTNLDYGAVWRLSWLLLAGPLLLVFWLGRGVIGWPRRGGGMGGRALRRQLGRGWYWGSGILSLVIWVLAAGVPLGEVLTTGRTWSALVPAFRAGAGALGNSFLFAVLVASLGVVLGVMTWRLRVGLLLWMPFLVPGVLLGVGVIFLFGGAGWEWIYPSVGLVILALTARYLAIPWNGMRQACRGMDGDLRDEARVSGATGWQLWRHVYWPQVGGAVLAFWYATYLLCLWDVGTVLLIIPPGGETVALRIFNLLHYGHNSQVNALCLLLVGLGISPLLLGWMGFQLSQLSRLGRGGVGAHGAVAVVVGAGLLLAGCGPEGSATEAFRSGFFERVEVIGSRGTGVGQFNKPRSVALDREDNLYVVDMTGRVQKFSSEGAYLGMWQMPETDLGRPKGMCLDGAGRIVVVEPHYSRVNHYSPEGELLAQWGDRGTNTGQLAFPRSAVVNSRGEIYVSEYALVERVQRFSAGGTNWLGSFGGEGAGEGQFNRPEGMGTDGEDRLYVADSCNHRVQVFSAEGDWLRSYGRAGSGLGEMSYPYDVRVDAGGFQFVCEFGNSRVQIFGPDDRPVEILGGVGRGPGRFNNPWSMAFDSKWNLYVADAGNHRVQKFIRRGKVASRMEEGGRGG